MSSRLRRITIVFTLLLVPPISYLGYEFLRLQAAAQMVTWHLESGGLSIHYFPLKNHVTIFVDDEYETGIVRTWVLSDPGGTNWWLVAPPSPSPEELLARAWISKPEECSGTTGQSDRTVYVTSGKGLVALFPDVSEDQKINIIAKLEMACEHKSCFCDLAAKLKSSQ